MAPPTGWRRAARPPRPRTPPSPSPPPPLTRTRRAPATAARAARRARAAPGAALLVSPRRGVRACDATDLLTAQGVIVGSLEEAAVNHPELVERGLGAIATGESKFLALWDALWRGGCFV